MLWLLNNQKTNTKAKPNTKTNESIEFYQVFIKNDQVYSNESYDIIYSLVSNISSELENAKCKIDLTKYQSSEINCKIKIIDHLFSFNLLDENLLDNNTNYVFATKINYICSKNNHYGVPIFFNTYKPVGSKRLPNLGNHDYTNTYKFNFKIYQIVPDNIQVQYIVETNLETNETRKYFITPNLNLIQTFFN